MRFHIESLGCAKNQVDSEHMIAALTAAGLGQASGPEDADLIVVNTCGFVRPAKEESIQTTLELRQANPQARLIVAGCLTQRYEADLRKELPEIDGFIGNRDPSGVADLALKLLDSLGPGAPRRRRRTHPMRRRLLSLPGSAYVRIADGCDNRCTYCAIPLIRGKLRSRGPQEVVREIQGFLRRGIHEVNLVAQDVASYGSDRGAGGIVDLLDGVLSLEGAFWLRLLYLHPDHFPMDLLRLARRDSRLLPYFDLPFQHASPRILRAMGRRGDGTAYLGLVRSIRTEVPGAVVRSTFLTGFPSETEADFRRLLDFQAAAALDWVGVFPYSREEGTPAADMKGHVPGRVAAERKRALERAQTPITEASLDRYVGSILDVLLEERVRGDRMYLGRCWAQAPEADTNVVVRVGLTSRLPRPGQLVRARIVRRNGVDLEGVVA